MRIGLLIVVMGCGDGMPEAIPDGAADAVTLEKFDGAVVAARQECPGRVPIEHPSGLLLSCDYETDRPECLDFGVPDTDAGVVRPHPTLGSIGVPLPGVAPFGRREIRWTVRGAAGQYSFRRWTESNRPATYRYFVRWSLLNPEEDWTRQWLGQSEGDFELDDIAVYASPPTDQAAFEDALLTELGIRVSTSPLDWSLLPRTAQALRCGGTIRLVLLGDSLMSNLSWSAIDARIMERYPWVRIELIRSVAGGKGVAYYAEENRVQDYVVAYDPDLVLIGGISNHIDGKWVLEPFESVVRQIYDALPKTEIILSSSASHIYPESSAAVAGFATELGTAYIDANTAIRAATNGAGLAEDTVRLDGVHMNLYGVAMLGRVFADPFTVPAWP